MPVDTLYSELRWIAVKAGLRPGWVWFRFKALSATPPTEADREFKLTVPSESLVALSKDHMSDWRYQKLLKAYEFAVMTPEQKEVRLKEIVRDKAFTSKARRELDAKRPRLEDM